MPSITTDQLFSLDARQNEIKRRLKAGSLDIRDVLAATQGILDGEYPQSVVELPDWYVAPEDQIEKVTAFLEMFAADDFCSEDIPAAPAGDGRVLLLTVFLPDKGEETGLQRTFDAWWQFAAAPEDHKKWSRMWIESGPEHLRLEPGYEYRPGIRWVVFSPSAYKGKSAMRAVQLAEAEGYQLAGVEVLMALGLFPEWPLSWTRDGYPNLSALQLRQDRIWWRVPYLDRGVVDFAVRLSAKRKNDAHQHWSSVRVREC